MLLLFHRKVLDNVWVGVNSYCFVSHLYCPTEFAWHAGIHLIVCQVSSVSFPLGYQKQKSSVFLTVLIRCHLQPVYLSPVLSIFLSCSLSLTPLPSLPLLLLSLSFLPFSFLFLIPLCMLLPPCLYFSLALSSPVFARLAELDTSIFEVSEAFPLFAYSVWKITALLSPSPET